MPEQFGEKTHEATPHRRQQARQQGHVAKSTDLGSAVSLLGALLALVYLGRPILQYLGLLARRQWGGQAWTHASDGFAVAQWQLVNTELAKVLLPVLGVMLVVAVAVNVVQVGFLFVPQKLALDLSRIDPLKGLQRLLSLSGAVRLAFGVFKVTVVGAVGCWSIWQHHDTILGLAALSVTQSAVLIVRLSLQTCLWIGGALLVLAILDYLYQRWKYDQDLRMTSQELREELKTLQGDPQLLARRRSVQRQLVLNRLKTSVPKADVVITNPTELAVAVQYDPQQMPAPVVVAKGAGVLAQRIRQLAREHDIPIVERKPLAQALYKQVEVRQPVPVQQYAAVAEVLRYVYQLKGKRLP